MSIALSDAAVARDLPPSMVERMTLILDEFAGPSTRLTLEDVARRTHLPRSTAHRILEQLVRLSWLDHTSFGYSLGSRSLGLGGRDNGHCEVRSAAAGQLHELHLRTGLTVHLGVLDGPDVYVLDKLGGRAAGRLPTRVGGRLCAACSGLGKAMLAWLSPEDVHELLTPMAAGGVCHRGVQPEQLHAQFNRIRMRRGLAHDRGEAFPGLRSVAAAVRGPEGAVAAIGLIAPEGAPLERVEPLVLDAALQVSRQLFPGMATLRTRTKTLTPVV